MIIKCPECGREISDKGRMCVGCGCPMDEIKSRTDGNNKIEPIKQTEVRQETKQVTKYTGRYMHEPVMEEESKDESNKRSLGGWFLGIGLFGVLLSSTVIANNGARLLGAPTLAISIAIGISGIVLLVIASGQKNERQSAYLAQKKEYAEWLQAKEEADYRDFLAEHNVVRSLIFTPQPLVRMIGNIPTKETLPCGPEIIFDNQNKQMVVGRNAVPFRDIIGAEIMTEQTITADGTKDDRLGRAVVGGILLGGAGAVVGASTGNQPQRVVMTNEYGVTVYLANVTQPKMIFTIAEGYPMFRDIYATVLAIVAQNSR